MLSDRDFCISAVFGTSYKSQATIKVYPREFRNLSADYVKQTFEGVHKDSYDSFVKKKFIEQLQQQQQQQQQLRQTQQQQTQQQLTQQQPQQPAPGAIGSDELDHKRKGKKNGKGKAEKKLVDRKEGKLKI